MHHSSNLQPFTLHLCDLTTVCTSLISSCDEKLGDFLQTFLSKPLITSDDPLSAGKGDKLREKYERIKSLGRLEGIKQRL